MSHNKKHHLRGYRHRWQRVRKIRDAHVWVPPAALRPVLLDAVTRACGMFDTRPSLLPPLAIEYCRYLCHNYGGCGEVCITAYAHYCQIVDGMPCKDTLYMPDTMAIAWFKDRGYTYTKPA